MDIGKFLLRKSKMGELVLPCHQSAHFATALKLKELVNKFYDNGTEITVTFHPILHNRFSETNLQDILRVTLVQALNKYKHDYKIVLVGEHSQTGMFHFHGIIDGVSNDYISKIKRKLAHDIGRTEIKTIKYFKSYIDYMFGSFDKNHPKGECPEEWHDYNYIVLPKINISDIL